MELIISKEVAGNTEDCVTAIPTAGKDVFIFSFFGSAAFSQNAVVKLVWDFGGTEELIWTVKGEMPMPFKYTIPSASVDGVKKLAVCLENTGTGSVYLSGYCEFKELG